MGAPQATAPATAMAITVHEPTQSPTPAVWRAPATAIGLRTERYGPAMTRSRAACAGNGVPLPRNAIVTHDHSPSTLPTVNTTAPTTLTPFWASAGEVRRSRSST